MSLCLHHIAASSEPLASLSGALKLLRDEAALQACYKLVTLRLVTRSDALSLLLLLERRTAQHGQVLLDKKSHLTQLRAPMLSCQEPNQCQPDEPFPTWKPVSCNIGQTRHEHLNNALSWRACGIL